MTSHMIPHMVPHVTPPPTPTRVPHTPGVRARQERVAFATCDDEDEVARAVRPLVGQTVKLEATSQVGQYGCKWDKIVKLARHDAAGSGDL